MSAARQAAFDLGHDAIGPEHIVVALIEEEGAAGQALVAAGATRDRVRREIAAVSRRWTGSSRSGGFPSAWCHMKMKPLVSLTG